MRTTLHGDGDDLKSYEQAVLARKAPTTLNLVPRRRGTMPAGSTVPSKSTMAVRGSSNNMNPPQRPAGGVSSASHATNAINVSGYGRSSGKLEEPLNHVGHGAEGSGTDRPGSSSTNSGLADTYRSSPTMSHTAYQNQQFVYHMQTSQSSSPEFASGHRESSAGVESDSGLSSSSPSMGYRPSFKRLASQTLGPPNAKRALLGPAGCDQTEEVFDEEEECRDEGERQRLERLGRGDGLYGGYGHGSTRRFSLPVGRAVGEMGGHGMTLPQIRTAEEHAEAAHG